jgi:hypothetical protein
MNFNYKYKSENGLKYSILLTYSIFKVSSAIYLHSVNNWIDLPTSP